jgi:hypothetical protein
MTDKGAGGSSKTDKPAKEPQNESGAHTQAGQQSQTGGGDRQHGQDRKGAADGGSKSGR